MDRVRCLSVPVNEKGIEEYDLGIDNTINIKKFYLSDEEFKHLYSGSIFDEINTQCDLLIDEYESEIIKPEHFKRCAAIISDQSIPVFKEAFETAVKYNTMLGLDF